MVTADVDKTVRELQAYKEEVERKLKEMVAGFAYDVTTFASSNTPIGNEEDLMAGLSGRGTRGQMKYARAYLDRSDRLGINAEVGFHQGAWYFSPTPDTAFNPEIQNADDAANEVESEARASYRLGQDFYIVATGPAFDLFEAGKNPQAPSGIIQPTEELIRQTYLVNLQRYYNRG